MTPAPVPVILACLAVAVTVTARSAASAAARFDSAARRLAGDKSESCDAGLVTSQRAHADRTSPLGYYSITDRAAEGWPCFRRSGLAFTAAVGGVLGGGGDRGGGGRLGLMAREEP